MRILFVWDSDYPWDIRVEKICATLIANGHEVHLVCRNRARKPLEETIDGLNIHRIGFVRSPYDALNGLYTFPAFFNPVWFRRMNGVLRRARFDFVIVRDLPMAPAALAVGKLNRVPVVLDMAESYPELIRLVWKFEPFRLANLFARNPFVVDLIERFVVRRVAHIFAMVEESRQRLLCKGVPGGRISIVSNTPVIERFLPHQSANSADAKAKGGTLELLYVGFVNYSRGLQNTLIGLKAYSTTNRNFVFNIVGKGNAEAYLRRMVSDLSLNENVVFQGWVDNRKVPELISKADVCIVPHPPSGHWNNTIPNKLFDYMAASKAVMVANAKPMERIVTELDCGLVYQDGQAESFVRQLSRLEDASVRARLGANGRRAVETHYNWSVDAEQMLASLSALATTQ